MRKLALLGVLGASLLLNAGCARWTLRPLGAQRDQDPAQMPEKLGALSAIMRSQASNQPASPAAIDAAVQDPEVQRTPTEGLDKIPRELAVARLSERQGDAQQAREIYLSYVAKDPTNPLPHHRLGVMAARDAKLDEAEAHLRKALEVAPPSIELLSDVGYLCYLQSNFDDAERFLLQALEQSPENASATNNLALVYGARGDFDKSLRYFRRVNDDAKSHANVAFAMTQAGRLEDARSEYLHALTIDKKLRSAAHALAQIETARKAAQQAAKRNGRSPAQEEAAQGMIELSSASESVRPMQQPMVQSQPQPMAAQFEPVARPAAPSSATVAATQARTPATTPRSVSVDPVADRLMPLPALPAEEVSAPQTFAVAEVPAARTAEPPHSAFTAQQNPTPNVFAQARQVAWEGDFAGNTSSGVVRIPASQPVDQVGNSANNERVIQPAVAIEPASTATPAAQPAVHLGLSDANDESPAAKAPVQPVKTQFSDFGAAPARLSKIEISDEVSTIR